MKFLAAALLAAFGIWAIGAQADDASDAVQCLALSLTLMYLIHIVQRDEEALVLDCQQYCLEHLVNRLYEPESLGQTVAPPSSSVVRTPGTTIIGHPEKLAR